MNMMDYRLTKYEKQKLQDIKQKKGDLLRKIKIEHPRTKCLLWRFFRFDS